MMIIGMSRLIAFWERHPAAERSLCHWFEVGRQQVGPARSTSGPTSRRVRFEVAGGDYRAVVAFDWRRSIAFVKFLGTHAQYDRIDALTVSRV